jgi:hypothetical protein
MYAPDIAMMMEALRAEREAGANFNTNRMEGSSNCGGILLEPDDVNTVPPRYDFKDSILQGKVKQVVTMLAAPDPKLHHSVSQPATSRRWEDGYIRGSPSPRRQTLMPTRSLVPSPHPNL